jgi:hypothetical protein
MNFLTLECLMRAVGDVQWLEKNGAHTREWMNKTQEFIDCAFSVSTNRGVKCPSSRYRNALCEDKRILTPHLCKIGFMPGYEVWTHHSESVHQCNTPYYRNPNQGH